MNTVPVTVDDHLAALLPAGKARAEIQRALDAERTAYRQSMNALSAKLDAARKTLRDEMASAALQGFLSAFSGENVGIPPPKNAAAQSYEYADAMLLERERAK